MVQFSEKRKEQSYFESLPTRIVRGAHAAVEREDVKPAHIPSRRPYVPEGEEIPD